MKVQLEPKFYKHEMDNPFRGKDRTKELFWKWERQMFGAPGNNGQLVNDYIVRGMELLLNRVDSTGTADDIPSEIKDASAPLEEKAVVAVMYSNELGQDLDLQNDPSQIRWTDYFKD